MSGSEAPPAAARRAVVVESWPARIHRPLDLFRLTGLVLGLLLLAGLAVVFRDTSRGANADLARLLQDVPGVFVGIVRLGAAFAALALPLAFMAREIVRGHARRLIEAVVTGLLALGVAEGVDWVVASLPSSVLYEALIRVGDGAAARPLDTYLTALFAFAAVVGVVDEPLWRRLLVVATAVYVIAAFTTTQASLQSLTLSLTLGAVVGIAVRYLAGSVNERPDGHSIADAVGQWGLHIDLLEEVPAGSTDHRAYVATTGTGGRLAVHVFDRELIASGAAYKIYRLLRVRAELAPAPALSLERVTEHRSLLALAALAADVPVPRLLAGLPCGPDSIVLVYECLVSTALQDPTDRQLDELWSSVNRLHHDHVTHRGLTAEALCLDASGRVVLPIPVDGSVFASDLRVSLDRAQLLITTAQLTDAQRAVRSARRCITDDELTAVLPVLQPIALPRETRDAVNRRAGLLEALREEIRAQTHHGPPVLAKVERIRPRAVVSIVAIIVAGYLLVGQLGSVDVLTVLSRAQWQWVPLVLLASAATYLAAALSLTGFVREKLPFARTLLAQLAASFAGFVTPPAVGGLAINVRYLQKARVAPAGIATSLGLSQAVNAALHVVLLIAIAAATGASADYRLPIPGWAFLVLGAVAGLILLALAVPAPRQWIVARVLPPLRQALPRLLGLLTTPTKLAEALLGSLLLNAFYIAALWFAVHAFNGQVGFAAAALIYLTGAAIGSASPTPGGLGAVEVALSTGLAAAGMPSAAAVSAVLLFRLATFWLPVPLGWIAMRGLQRREAI